MKDLSEAENRRLDDVVESERSGKALIKRSEIESFFFFFFSGPQWLG